MKTLRTAMGVTVSIVLAAGYAASQWAALHGEASAYTEALSRLPLAALAGVVFVAACAFALVRDGDAEEKD